jgi:hypothetical protein
MGVIERGSEEGGKLLKGLSRGDGIERGDDELLL